jgi:hypothetical protein
MPHLAKKTHTDFLCKNHEINEIAQENIRVIDARPHVTLRWISARFKITHALLLTVLSDVEEETPVYTDGHDHWIDDVAWVEICNHPFLFTTFNEAARLAVLQLLGHYQKGGDNCRHLPVNGRAPLDCELVVCQCAAEK